MDSDSKYRRFNTGSCNVSFSILTPSTEQTREGKFMTDSIIQEWVSKALQGLVTLAAIVGVDTLRDISKDITELKTQNAIIVAQIHHTQQIQQQHTEEINELKVKNNESFDDLRQKFGPDKYFPKRK